MYDFGDWWEHRIVIESVSALRAGERIDVVAKQRLALGPGLRRDRLRRGRHYAASRAIRPHGPGRDPCDPRSTESTSPPGGAGLGRDSVRWARASPTCLKAPPLEPTWDRKGTSPRELPVADTGPRSAPSPPYLAPSRRAARSAASAPPRARSSRRPSMTAIAVSASARRRRAMPWMRSAAHTIQASTSRGTRLR